MRERKPAVDLRLPGILRREEVVEFFLRIDCPRVRVTEAGRALQEIALDRFEHSGRLPNEFFRSEELLRFHGLITPADCYFAGLEITRPEFNSQRHALFDPFPILHATAEIAAINFNFDRCAGVLLRAQLARQLLRSFEDSGACLFLRRDRQNYDLRRLNARPEAES